MVLSIEKNDRLDELQSTRQIKSLNDVLDKDLLADYKLMIQGAGQSCELDIAPVLIGRDPSCQIQIPSSDISRFHSVIHRAGRQTVIRDLHSTNGVILNQTRIYHAPLRVGDTFQLGDHHFEVVLGARRDQDYRDEAVVVFMDVANSTRLSEQHGPDFSRAVHTALARIEDQIFWHQGCPLKHLGDGLMAGFGIWPEQPASHSPADAALKAAVEAIRQIHDMPEFPGTRLRVGLAFGDVSVRQQDFLDLFGDTVSLASRMENANKRFGTQLLMSDSFFNRLKFRNGIREVDTVRVQGRSQPVRLYTWDERVAHTRNFLFAGLYHIGLEHYRQGDFEKAYHFFSRAADAGDILSQSMKQRLEDILLDEPPVSWDGVWNLDKA